MQTTLCKNREKSIEGDGSVGFLRYTLVVFLPIIKFKKEIWAQDGKEVPELEFTFRYDTVSFLQYYSKIISLAGLQRLTGIDRHQLSHYVTGQS